MRKSTHKFVFVTTVGLDLAKHVFQVHCIDASGRVVVANAIGATLLRFASLPRCLVELEASGRRITGRASYHARPRRAHDASGLCEALHSPAEERRSGRGGDLRGGDAAFDAVCRCALAGEPGRLDAAQGAGDVGYSANATC